jgi:hypothetical protein|tara:strand:- start:3896 stop:4345 length:450 start_codon:yes stop_codon:yes gene_type:complete
MLNLDDILAMWKKDTPIDEMHLDDASRDGAKLHAKYLELLMTTKLQKQRQESKLKLVLRDKWLWYNGKMTKSQMDDKGWSYDPFNGLAKPLKGEMDYYYNSDPEILKIHDTIEYYKTLIDTLDEIMQNIKWRHQTIKNMIEWRKFTSGG